MVADRRPLRICFASLHYGAEISTSDLDAYLTRAPIHRELPRALAARGHQVALVHLYPFNASFWQDGVDYRFVKPGPLARLIGGGIGRGLRRDPAVYQPATRAIQAIRAWRPEVVHFHGLTLTWNLFLLLRALGRADCPVVGHYHGGYPATQTLARRVQRFNFDRLARLLFTTQTHAQPFLEAGLLADHGRVVELVETSSTFKPGDRQIARQRTGLTGRPVFVWVGRLHPIKDPLTALRGFERIAVAWPDAHLYMYYPSDELLPEVRAFLGARPDLARRIALRGRASFIDMEEIYNSADFLLQASQREFSGCAVLEALACGVIPVVTDIPSFRAMTDDGRHAVLFPRGDAESLARQVLTILPSEISRRSSAARAWFERALSFDAMAAKLEEIYRTTSEEARAMNGARPQGNTPHR